jgi:AcrR family transcriptional regulator
MDEPVPKMVEKKIARGRPRSVASRAAILSAAFELLVERGYAQLAIEAVAAKAGVAKATIYRWWPDRPSLVVEAFLASTQERLAFPNTGSARQDFQNQILELAATLRGPEGRAFAGLLEGARIDPDVARAVSQGWIAPRKKWGHDRLRRAIAEHQCPDTLDIDAALLALYSPIYASLLLGMGVPSPARVKQCFELVAASVFLPENAKPKARRN